jgi:hypothetical protein
MQTICAAVNPRLLTKANRLFTGCLSGRIIEILQNARRAGATRVDITNADGCVTVHDNGRGIADFAALLDLGGSAWEEQLEASEDPAGVGLFCLAPRELTIRSGGETVTLSGDGWTGAPVDVVDDPEPVQGTLLRFADEPWTIDAVTPHAVFSGLDVTVDGEACAREPFVSDQATPHPELGCRIEVRESDTFSAWHRTAQRGGDYGANAIVNFHGQTVAFDCHPVSETGLHFLVDLTGEPTGIRLMLPARTQLVENAAFQQLHAALELEAYRYLRRRGHHSLPYKEYLRAQELGITLPEATPTFSVGLLGCTEAPEPVAVVMPEGFPLSQCYRLDPDADGNESDETNVHLLAALGRFKVPFVPVDIRSSYDGYSWARLPLIKTVEVAVGKELHQDWVWGGTLTCVDSITITAHTSDGRVFSAPVCMAKAPEAPRDTAAWAEDHVLVTPGARHLRPSEVWHHLGGCSDEGDTYDTQQHDFEQQLDQFWMQWVGPDEQLRQGLRGAAASIQAPWNRITLFPSGTVTIRFTDGTARTLRPSTP